MTSEYEKYREVAVEARKKSSSFRYPEKK